MTDRAAAFGNPDLGVEQALADLEREKRKLREVSRIWEEGTTTVRSKDNSFSMTFDGRGELTDLTFNGSKYRSLPPAQLAHLIIETLRQGRNQAVAKVQEVMGTGRRPSLDFAGIASGKVDPMEMVNSLLGPMLEGFGLAEGETGKGEEERRKNG
ncbi:YbaB/EbfC family nucleoid-associated protein [Amycolatopsis cynarae]|uniref:YbaB/EbfC family nucleoid-associated protein n=1 Tax=Amycolatopsis cynarae TaxID=2995223 RepID=A0ABY7B6N2_9PSEU|nr:YbaB/EbfC family nucleoid-associated protein [Amycolatopsis sp. HUAS 11-8]WAL66526.1 YbaB/EbfC family nucleoid-associated protein [Amycolatopsis sp. HUAS 11-8]